MHDVFSQDVPVAYAERIVILRPNLVEIVPKPGERVMFSDTHCIVGDTTYECTEAIVEARGETRWFTLQWRIVWLDYTRGGSKRKETRQEVDCEKDR